MKKFKALKIVGIIVACIFLFFAVINIIPPAKNVESNPFVVEKVDNGDFACLQIPMTWVLNFPWWQKPW